LWIAGTMLNAALQRTAVMRLDEAVGELVFEVAQEADGGYCAECLTESIFTQGDSWGELRANVKEAVAGFYFDRPGPEQAWLHLVRDEMLALK
jgi:hypothetical protein